MFRRFVITAAVLFACVFAFKLEDFPPAYRGEILKIFVKLDVCTFVKHKSLELMPEPLKNFITGLSDADKATMREVYHNFHTYKNDDEV